MRRLRDRLGGEGGIALVVALVVLSIGLLFVGAAATRALSTNDTTRRDLDSRRAMQAAQAGLRIALYRMNALALDLNQVLNLQVQCVLSVSSLVNFASQGSGFCPTGTGSGNVESLGNGVSFDYRISPLLTLDLTNTNTLVQSLLRRHIVATGTSHGVTRRVYADVVALGSNAKKCSLLGLLGVCVGTWVTNHVTLATYRLATAADVANYPAASPPIRPFRECTAKPFSDLPAGAPDQGCY